MFLSTKKGSAAFIATEETDSNGFFKFKRLFGEDTPAQLPLLKQPNEPPHHT